MRNSVLEEDIRQFADSFSLSDLLENKTILITGATGLIGSVMVRCLLALNRNIRIIAPVRNMAKAETIFSDDARRIELIECDLVTFNYDSLGRVDYVIHGAAPTSSKFFVDSPVETFEAITHITTSLLQYARRHAVEGFVFLSSLEVYGSISDDSEFVTEEKQGWLDPLSVRSCYPMAKRAMETLCCLYAAEYGVPAKIARLTQTFGAGVSADDNRVVAQFARLIAEGKDIVLHTTGESARPYCYTTDAVSAILYVLLKGGTGQAYNVANDDSYISVRNLAFFLQKNFRPDIKVCEETSTTEMGYAPTTRQRLSSQKLRTLGWSPRYDLHDMLERLIKSIS